MRDALKVFGRDPWETSKNLSTLLSMVEAKDGFLTVWVFINSQWDRLAVVQR